MPHDPTAEPVVVVTGGSSGIGLAIARQFAQRRYRVVICGRDSVNLENARKEILTLGSACEALALNLENPEAGQNLIHHAHRTFGRIDVVVNNAGTAPLAPVDQLVREEYYRAMAINVDAVFHITQSVWPIYKNQGGGIIINISSLSSLDPFPGFSVYGASKAWVNLFSKSTADEGRPFGIRVFSVGLGAVETRMLRGLFPDFPKEQTLMPEDVASLVSQLCDDSMKHASGQTIFFRK